MTLGEMIDQRGSQYSGKVAMKFKDESWIYSDLAEQTSKMANGLKKLGVQKGDKVGLLMLNSPYFIISYFSIIKLGATVVPVNVMYKGGEVTYLLNDSKAVALITSPAFMPMITEIRSQLKTVKDIIIQDRGHEQVIPGLVSLGGMLDNEATEFIQDSSITEEDIAVYLYTSGTTGNPKGAMLSHKNLLTNAADTGVVLEENDSDTTLCVLPMFHSFAWTCCVSLPLYCGGTIVILESFMPQAVLNAITKDKSTIIAGVPTMYNVLLQADIKPADFNNVRHAISGGASLPVEILKKFEEKYEINILEGYGLSECSPVCTLNPYRGIRKPGSIGKVLPGVDCKIVDDNGNEVARNTAGELIFKGPNVMQGYYNLPEATAEALKDGWMYTGDIGYMDEEGYIFIIDRKKDLILVGGLNVYPREIEEVLYTNPKVAEAAVIGVPDELRGEMVKAFIALKQGETASEREMVKYCQERLANYKLPKTVEFLEAIPKTSTGKILKRALRK